MTPEQEGLVRKARESVRAARLLAREELYDISASRAYYAMFYIAQAFLLGLDLSFSKHSAVHAAFGSHFARTGVLPVELHRQLIDAARLRSTADYGVGPSLSREDAETLIAHAETFVRTAEERLDTITPDAGHPQRPHPPT